MGLVYIKFSSILEGYIDASWITRTSDNKSTFGWILTLGGTTISWDYKKQLLILHSTMKFQFITLVATRKVAKVIRNLLLDIELLSKPMLPNSLYCDIYKEHTTKCIMVNVDI